MLEKFAVLCVVAFIVIGVVPAVAQGQDQGKTLVPPTPTVDGANVTQIFRIEFANVEDIASVISLFGGIVRPQPDLRVIAWTGPESQLPAVEAAIRSLDVAPVPAPNVEITVYFVMAAKGGSGKTSVPATLDSVRYGYLIGQLYIAAGRQAPRYPGDIYTGVLKQLVDVSSGRFSLRTRVGSQYYLFKILLLYPRDEFFQP